MADTTYHTMAITANSIDWVKKMPYRAIEATPMGKDLAQDQCARTFFARAILHSGEAMQAIGAEDKGMEIWTMQATDEPGGWKNGVFILLPKSIRSGLAISGVFRDQRRCRRLRIHVKREAHR
jgi:hypothetical protein